MNTNTIVSVIIIIAAVAALLRMVIQDKANGRSDESGLDASEPKLNEEPEYWKPRKGVIDQSAGFFKEMLDEGKRAYKEQNTLFDNHNDIGNTTDDK